MNDERTRDNDHWLIIQVLKEMGFKIFIPFDKLDVLPAFESITRCRRKFQEKGEYLASPKVAEHREEERKEMMKIDKWLDV